MKNHLLLITIISCFYISSILTMENENNNSMDQTHTKYRVVLEGSTPTSLGNLFVAYTEKTIFPVCNFEGPKKFYVKNNTGKAEEYSHETHGELGTIALHDYFGSNMFRAIERKSNHAINCPATFMLALYIVDRANDRFTEIKNTKHQISREELLRNN